MMASNLPSRTSIILLLILYGNIEGLVTISPPDITLVCRGHQLDLTCTVTGSFLEWTFFFIPENRTTAIRHTFALTSLSTTNQLSKLQVNSTIFTFSRSSAQNITPLVSRLAINPTSDGLNGTAVTCSDVETSESMATTIQIIKPIQEHQEVEIPLLSEHFGRDDITISLEWKQNNPHYYYNVSIVPQSAVPVMSVESGRVNFTVFYNTHYNVSIHTIPPCAEYNLTRFMELYYSKCEDPAIQIVNFQVEVVGYSNPAIEGTEVMFSCPIGQVFTGRNGTSAICMGNGNWEPDLGEVECKAICGLPIPPPNGIILPYSNTLEGAMITYMCWTIHKTRDQSLHKVMNVTATCSADGTWEPRSEDICAEPPDSNYSGNVLNQDERIIVASVMVFVVSSCLFFIIVFLCGHFYRKGSKAPEIMIPGPSVEVRQGDNVQLKQQKQEELELETNVAYGSVY